MVSLAPSPANYTVGSPGSAVVQISGSSAQPTATLTSATTYLDQGEPYNVAVGLSQAVSTPTTIALSYGGSAVLGTDYTRPAGSVVVPAGQTSVTVQIPTVTSNVVEPNKILTVSLAPSSSYLVGSPSSATVTITSQVLPTLTITGNTTTVAQGGAASFTISADQAPVKNIRSTSPPRARPAGPELRPLAGTAVLKAGQTSVTVVLQSIQSNITFEPTDMIVGAWPTHVGQVFVKAGASVAPGEAILSLTEPDLSVTLQATAAQRSELAVGQKCTIQISGREHVGHRCHHRARLCADDGDGEQRPVLAGLRGSHRRVGSHRGRRLRRLHHRGQPARSTTRSTVPISAVKQNGSGVNVVRVINLNQGGRVTEVTVKTGLTEGSYIQIKSGLHLNQLVIAGANQSS